MAHGCSLKMFNNAQHTALTELAHKSITHGVRHGGPIKVELDRYDPALRVQGACFVTLHKQDQLRGCIGSLQTKRALVEDVAQNAYAAAFQDPRFSPMQENELEDLSVHISVLSQPESLNFSTEDELLKKIRPGVDGLILINGGHRGTFLPSVWDALPQPKAFLRQLKLKAGLAEDYWSDSIKIERYTTESW
ncbi:MAG TPA: AmmeMemoRadiSam system protein A [Acidiferrobacteraceae bacterium]|nr:AmmeMemoRadiSam system protein A [Acidiferrobacteraceae bacterium]